MYVQAISVLNNSAIPALLSRSYPNLNFLSGVLCLINDLAMVQVFVTRLFGF